MTLFAASLSSVSRHGVYAIARKPPLTLRSQGTSTTALVGQFPWGPTVSMGTGIYQPADIGDALRQFCPPGFDHTNSAYLALTGKSWPDLRLVRVMGHGTTPVNASVAIVDSGAVTILTVTAKYPGTAGNSITATCSAATAGTSGWFKLTVSITGASGTTTEVIDNINLTGTGTQSTFPAGNLANYVLIGTIVPGAAGTPVLSTLSFTGGTSPAVVSSDYVGTLGSGDKGFALLEGDRAVRAVCCDDPGNSIRSSVNAGMLAHVEYMGDRVAYIAGPSGQTAAAARTDAATYSSLQVVYIDAWHWKRDDVDGTEHLVPGGAMAASVAANLAPSTSIAWKAQEVRALLGEVTRLESQRGAAAATNSDAGVVTIIKEDTGGFTYESAHVTSYLADATTGDLTRTRMAIYLVTAFSAAMRTMVDAPNVQSNQDSMRLALVDFLTNLKLNRDRDPNHNVHIQDFQVGAANTVNSTSTIQAGQYIIPADVVTSAAMEKVALSLSIGPTVVLSSNLTS